MGRKSKYDELCANRLTEIENWVKSGATDEEVAQALGISVTTLYEYKKKYSEFLKAFACGRKEVIINIKAALLKKALGYEYTEEKRTGRKDKEGESVVLVEKFTRHMPPSETAAAMLLRNYDKEWLDKDTTSTELKKQEVELKKAIAEASNFDLDV